MAFALLHWVQLRLGSVLARAYLKVVQYVFLQSPLRRLLNPVSAEDMEGPELLPDPARPYVSYPYYYGAVGLISKLFFGYDDPNFDVFNAAVLPKDPSLPYLFMWGQDKNTFFHSTMALAKLEERKQQGYNAKYLGLPGGHWFFNQISHDRTAKEIAAFMGLTLQTRSRV